MQIIDLTKLSRYDYDLKEWLPIKKTYELSPTGSWDYGAEIRAVNNYGEFNPIKVTSQGEVYISSIGNYHGGSSVVGCQSIQTVLGNIGGGQIPTSLPAEPTAGSCYFTSSSMYGYLHIYNGSDWFSIQLEIEATPEEQDEGGGEIANP